MTETEGINKKKKIWMSNNCQGESKMVSGIGAV